MLLLLMMMVRRRRPSAVSARSWSKVASLVALIESMTAISASTATLLHSFRRPLVGAARRAAGALVAERTTAAAATATRATTAPSSTAVVRHINGR